MITRLSITLITALLIAGFGAAPSAKADIFTFKDLTDTLTFSQDGTNDTVDGTQSGCNNLVSVELCQIVVSRSGTLFTGNVQEIAIGENSSPTAVLSDVVALNQLNGGALILFQSDSDAEPATCFAVGGCSITEDGTVQTAFTFTWANGAVDTVKFQSDVESTVPEPSSILLLLTVLGGLAGSGYRRRRLS